MLRKLFLLLFTLVLVLNSSNVLAAFSDVNSKNPYYYDIVRLQNAGFINGDENGHFNPEQGINRCEMAKLTVKVLESFQFDIYPNSFAAFVIPQDSAFPDVPESSWCRKYVLFLKEKSIVRGDEQGNFDPWRQVNIAESLKMILTAAHIDTGGMSEFEASAADWYKPFMAYFRMYGLEDASVTQSTQPNNIAFRKTIARIITRLIDQNEYGNSEFEHFRWEVDMYGDLGPRYDYLSISFSYPSPQYFLEEADGVLIFYEVNDDGTRGEKAFTLEYLGGSALDTVRIADCAKTGGVQIGVNVFNRFECNTGPEEDYQFHYYGYYIQIGEQYLHATNNLNDTGLQDFEGILHSLKWILH